MSDNFDPTAVGGQPTRGDDAAPVKRPRKKDAVQQSLNSGSGGVAADQLRAFIERIERMEEEKKAVADDIKEIYAEAKGTGFDTKVLRKVISIRKMDMNERLEQEAVLDTYLHALGMAGDRDE